MIDVLDTDILILGAGGAGLGAALHTADAPPALELALVQDRASGGLAHE